MRIVLLGAPGSGKGTQGTRLADRLGVAHVSSGDLLRALVAGDTDLGRRVAGFVTSGLLVPDDLVLEAIGGAVVEAARAGGYVLDGFPRTIAQAERAYALAAPAGITADAVVHLAVPDHLVVERIAARASAGRADDADPLVIARRLEVFHAETEPLLAFYRGRGLLHEIDGSLPPDEVTERVATSLGIR